MNFLTPFKTNNRSATYIIAEAGVHHGCDLENAKKLIQAAAESGADAIKFQTYKSGDLVTKWAPKYWLEDDDSNQETQFDYFARRDKFNLNEYQLLNQYSKECGIVFISTPFDNRSVQWLEQLDVPFWKIASADIDNFPLLEMVSATCKPILLSTGASYFDEINKTLEFLKQLKVKNIALLHCNLSYPTPDEQANLSRIVKLKKRFPNLLIGYSDHTVPDRQVTIPTAAVALGAEIVEKHFTLDRTIPKDDHYHSIDPVLLNTMVEQISTVEKATSNYVEITESELPARKNARRSLVASRQILNGERLTPKMMVPKRPGGGISPSQLNRLIGKKVLHTIEIDEQLTWDSVE